MTRLITRNGGARIDTYHGPMTNLQDTEPGGLLSERDLQPRRRPLPVRAWRALRRAVLLPWYRWQLDALMCERETYQDVRAAGPEYLKNCARQERVLRGRIAFLESDL